MSILWMMIVGFVVGALAKVLMPGRDPGGVLMTVVVGICGSLLAGVTGQSFGWYAAGEPTGFIASVLGAILLLALYRVIKPRRNARKGRVGSAA
jgi:uncharacterized membrane protein YeaQ/YmgE (transglycosylase-associated protein family)